MVIKYRAQICGTINGQFAFSGWVECMKTISCGTQFWLQFWRTKPYIFFANSFIKGCAMVRGTRNSLLFFRLGYDTQTICNFWFWFPRSEGRNRKELLLQNLLKRLSKNRISQFIWCKSERKVSRNLFYYLGNIRTDFFIINFIQPAIN